MNENIQNEVTASVFTQTFYDKDAVTHFTEDGEYGYAVDDGRVTMFNCDGYPAANETDEERFHHLISQHGPQGTWEILDR